MTRAFVVETTGHGPTNPRITVWPLAVILAVVTHDGQRKALLGALERRFAADYNVVARADGPDLEAFVRDLDEIAVAIAPIKSDDFRALGFVQHAHRLVRRIALID